MLSVFPQSILLPIIRARSSSWKIAYNGKRRVSNRQWSYYRGTQLVLYSLALHQRETNDTVFPFRHKTRCQVMQQQLEKAQEERERFMVSELQVMVCSIDKSSGKDELEQQCFKVCKYGLLHLLNAVTTVEGDQTAAV